MRIGYFADGPWSHGALDRILGHADWTIAFIAARHPRPDPVLEERARSLGVPFVVPPKVNAPEFLAFVADMKPDINVSMSYDQILRRPIIDSAPLGFINCHAGALPFYRGRNILNWVLINGEDKFGVTVHHVDEGIDTGDIVVQRFAPIGPDDDYAALLEKAFALCPEVLDEALSAIAAGTAPRIRQSTIHPVGLYCGRRVPGDELLDWAWPSKRVHDFVRGISLPGPGARTFFKDGELAILKTRMIPEAPAYIGTPGEVVGRTPRGVVVKTGDTSIEVCETAAVLPGGGLDERRIPALAIGTRLGRRS